jgi:hypothetical protein
LAPRVITVRREIVETVVRKVRKEIVVTRDP